MSTKTKTTTTEASAEDRRRVQDIGDDDEGGSGSTMHPVDWQRQRTLSLLCLVAVQFWYCFHQITFFFTSKNTIKTAIVQKYFYTKFTLTLRMYLLRTGELKTTSSHYQ